MSMLTILILTPSKLGMKCKAELEFRFVQSNSKLKVSGDDREKLSPGGQFNRTTNRFEKSLHTHILDRA